MKAWQPCRVWATQQPQLTQQPLELLRPYTCE